MNQIEVKERNDQHENARRSAQVRPPKGFPKGQYRHCPKSGFAGKGIRKMTWKPKIHHQVLMTVANTMQEVSTEKTDAKAVSDLVVGKTP